jgi:hypothetical protein
MAKFHVEMLGNLKVLKSQSIEISQNLLLQKRARTPNQELLHDKKAVLPLIFAIEHAGLVTLVVSSKRGTLEGVGRVILHGFLALISFYKVIAMPPY